MMRRDGDEGAGTSGPGLLARYLPIAGAVVVGALVCGTGLAGAAGAGSPIPWNSVNTHAIKDGTVAWSDLSPAVRAKILAGAPSSAGQRAAVGLGHGIGIGLEFVAA